MGDLRSLRRMWRSGARAVVAGLILGALVLVQAAASSAAATSARKTGWSVIRTIGPDNTDLTLIAAFRNHASWLGGMAYNSTAGQFYAVVYQLTSGPLHQTALTMQLGTGVNGLSATSPTNVWASLQGVVPGAQVDRLTRHGWHRYSFAIRKHDIYMAPVVTTGPKNTWVLTEDLNTKIAYGYRFDGSKWRRHTLPAAPDSNALSGYVTASAASNIWTLTSTSAGQPASMRYNGSKWQIINFPRKLGPAAADLGPEQILALSPKDVWATFSPNNTAGVAALVLLHWNGKKWSKITGKLPDASLTGAIASDGTGGVWLAAANAAGTVPLILHYSHGKWSTSAVPKANGKLIGIEQLTLVPGTRSVLGAAIIAGSGESTGGTAVVEFRP
jgi:hypothetical protein